MIRSTGISDLIYLGLLHAVGSGTLEWPGDLR